MFKGGASLSHRFPGTNMRSTAGAPRSAAFHARQYVALNEAEA